jgi:hypothetical protein
MTEDQLHALFDYQDGFLFWKVDSSQNVKAGQKAGGVDSRGRWRIGINGKQYQAHRLIFLMHQGHVPSMLDHIDGNPLNNRIENLRPANFSTNGCNRKLGINNTSGVKGLTWNKPAGKWQASVKVNKKTHYFGYYKHKEIAEAVLLMARQRLHGEYMRAR